MLTLCLAIIVGSIQAKRIRTNFEIINEINCKLRKDCFIQVICSDQCHSDNDKWANCYSKIEILNCDCNMTSRSSPKECVCQQRENFICNCSRDSKSVNQTCVNEYPLTCSSGHFDSGYYGCQKILECTQA